MTAGVPSSYSWMLPCPSYSIRSIVSHLPSARIGGTQGERECARSGGNNISLHNLCAPKRVPRFPLLFLEYLHAYLHASALRSSAIGPGRRQVAEETILGAPILVML
ncbi:hypothetical protein F4821DRAFT_235518 [Hypoxylon rubiginosum]|uniref:Uncharacterized protein n=1 Tax=Hypoxylon rubiginosum TaxID=110542 RepID=A0ACC0D4W4_9PEZI|nr:hypothetical protein F4821DRAFT_235518 [Hypoxylon rubiginosum]